MPGPLQGRLAKGRHGTPCGRNISFLASLDFAKGNGKAPGAETVPEP
jgi:hypothetical protein